MSSEVAIQSALSPPAVSAGIESASSAVVAQAKAKPVKSPVAQALATVNAQVAQFDKLETGFAALEARYKDVVYDVTATKGMDEAKKARQEIRQVRYNAAALLKEAKAPLNAVRDRLNETAEKIVGRVLLIEDPIDTQIKAEEERKANEKAVRERLAAEALAKVQAALDGIRGFVVRATGKTSAENTALSEELYRLELSLEIFGDRAGEAAELKDDVLGTLVNMYDAAVTAERASTELAEQAAAQIIAAKKLADDRKRLDDERATIQATIDAERATLQAEKAAFAAQQAAAQEAAEDKAKAEREAAEAPARAAAAAKQLEEHNANLARIANLAEEDRIARELVAEAARKDKLVRDAAQDLLARLEEVFTLLDRAGLVATLGSYWVEGAEGAIAKAIGAQA